MDVVTSLLHEAEVAGLTVHADGDKLVVRGPRRAEATAKKLIAHKAEIMPVLVSAGHGPAIDPAWGEPTIGHIRWFLKSEPPAAPFELNQAIVIAHPKLFWSSTRGDILAGPKKARSYYGSLQNHLARLYELFGPSGDQGK